MRDAITPYRIANQIRMRRDDNTHSGTFLIVEGRSDKLLYERFINSEKCEFSIAYSKNNATGALRLLEEDNFVGVLAIVDADFSILEGTLPYSPNILLTDYHDLEIMLIKSPALEKVLRERGSENKIIKFGKDICQTLLESGKIIGYLRWVSLKFDLSLKFEELAFNKFLDQTTLAIDTLKLIKVVKDHSQKPALKEKDIQDSLDSLKDDSHDPCHVCCGHDLMCILSIGLCKTLGSWNYNEVKPETIERELRLAYEHAHFRNTQLYISIQKWEENNQPYQVLLALP